MRKGGVHLARIILLSALGSGLTACVTNPAVMDAPPPYFALSVDETMTCEGIANSFRFAARRAARLEYWLSIGPLGGYGNDRFALDAPKQLVDERRRMDALSDLQRVKGCRVMEPGPAVVEERLKLENSVRPPSAPVVLNSRG